MDKQQHYIRAIHDVYPELNVETVQLNQSGQFNDILLINGETIFRFPKTLREAVKLVTECGLLWSLKNFVTLPIPTPLYQSLENTSVGEVFMGYPLLPGEPFWPEKLRALKSEEQVQHIADQMATFLRCLHTISVKALKVELPSL